MKMVQLQYFALLRDQRGTAEETLATDARTAGELYDQLRVRHGLTLGPAHVRAALNGEFASWDTPLREGDTVVFIPPVAGG
ncbi:MAG: molybdopterin converting factor subunit 1 [Terriglobales bacterium]